MSPLRWLVSLVIVGHLTGLGVASVPSPASLPHIDLNHPAADDDPLSRRLTPTLNRAAVSVFDLSRRVWSATALPRRFAEWYVGVTGLAQRWSMFSTPLEVSEYVRVRYYVGPDDGGGFPKWTATELVLPAHREDRWRGVQSYRDAFRDKAILNALRDFARYRPSGAGGYLAPGSLPDDLVPVGRYFARRFAKERLASGERVVRMEIWYGTKGIPPPSGQERPAGDVRRAWLQEYYDDEIRPQPVTLPFPAYRQIERATGVDWILEYFEEV